MKLYQKLRTENEYNSENIQAIENVAGEALDYMGKHCEHAIKSSDITQDGFLRLEFVEGQDLDEQSVTEEMQEIFDERFSELVSDELNAPKGASQEEF